MSTGDLTTPLGDATRPERPHALTLGERIGRYRLVERLGAGGMGTVFRAFDPQLSRAVALKVVHARRADSPRALLPEARGLAMLTHDNVVQVLSVERTGEGHWAIAMELMEGGSLRAWIDRGQSTWAIVDRMIEAGQGLVALHAAGLVHRDFKPANVLLAGDGRVCLTDLGLVTAEDPATSRELFSDDAQTRHDEAVGTPAYMAPEQHRGDVVDARADQYAFCVALWESVTGVRPFAGRDLASLVHAKLHGPLRGRRARGVPRRLLRILARGLAPLPQRRWPSMTALLDELRRVRTSVQRRPWRLAVAASIVVAVGAALVPTSPGWGPGSGRSGPPRLALGSGPR